MINPANNWYAQAMQYGQNMVANVNNNQQSQTSTSNWFGQSMQYGQNMVANANNKAFFDLNHDGQINDADSVLMAKKSDCQLQQGNVDGSLASKNMAKTLLQYSTGSINDLQLANIAKTPLAMTDKEKVDSLFDQNNDGKINIHDAVLFGKKSTTQTAEGNLAGADFSKKMALLAAQYSIGKLNDEQILNELKNKNTPESSNPTQPPQGMILPDGWSLDINGLPQPPQQTTPGVGSSITQNPLVAQYINQQIAAATQQAQQFALMYAIPGYR